MSLHGVSKGPADEQADSQDKTQLTLGGKPVASEFTAGDIIGGDRLVRSAAST